MKDYKQEIEETRVGHLGSSDASMVALIDSLGSVPKSSYNRLAIVKGIKENDKDKITSSAMIFGDRIENEIFAYLQETGKAYESNPMWVSKKYSRKNVKVISHPDYVLKDDATKTLFVYEVKASKHTTLQVRQEYRCQLYWHTKLAQEKINEFGEGWKAKIFLVHYSTSGIDAEELHCHEFDPGRLTIKEVRFQSPVFDMANGMDIINAFLDTFDDYYESEEIDADMLPTNVKEQFLTICDTLSQIKQMEHDVDSFKQRIYEFMREKDIKSIKNDFFTISRVDPSESVSFDFKRFLEDYAKDHPTKVKWIKHKYEKRMQRKGYATIKIKQ